MRLTLGTRKERIAKVKKQRQKNVVLVLENIKDERNISPIIRSAECFGIPHVFVIYNAKKPALSLRASKGGSKWIKVTFYKERNLCFAKLKAENYKIVSLVVDPTLTPLWDVNLNEKIALIMGNEAQGVSEETQKESDKNVFIPMLGITESLNVSAATAITLYEVTRQRNK